MSPLLWLSRKSSHVEHHGEHTAVMGINLNNTGAIYTFINNRTTNQILTQPNSRCELPAWYSQYGALDDNALPKN